MAYPKTVANISCQNCQNMNCFIKSCSAEWIQIIDNKKSENFYQRGQHFILKGKPILGLFFIKKGKVKVTSNSWQGKEQIVRLANDGHIVGHRGYGTDIYQIGATALDDSVICFVDNSTIYEAFMNNSKLTYNLMMFYSKELRGVESRIKGMAQMTVYEKVVSVLLYLIDIFGIDKDNILNLYVSRGEMASLSGTNEEQVVRTLTDLGKGKIIAKVKRKIKILNKQKLEKVIELYR